MEIHICKPHIGGKKRIEPKNAGKEDKDELENSNISSVYWLLS